MRHRRAALLACLVVPGLGLLQAAAPASPPAWRVEAIRYATIPAFPLAGLIPGAPAEERLDIAMVVWLLRGDGRTVLFDAGFHREPWAERFGVTDYLRPDSAVALAGVSPEDVTDIVVSHAHWDHMGGIDLFPNATLWIQEGEYRYYTADAWQEGGRRGGIDPADVLELVRRNTAGQVRLITGDSVEILPGLRVFTGARHTFASQYLLVEGDPPLVLASDNCYLWRNIEEGLAGATFLPDDREENLAALERMRRLAGSAQRVIPGHDPLQFERYPSRGRVADLRSGDEP